MGMSRNPVPVNIKLAGLKWMFSLFIPSILVEVLNGFDPLYNGFRPRPVVEATKPMGQQAGCESENPISRHWKMKHHQLLTPCLKDLTLKQGFHFHHLGIASNGPKKQNIFPKNKKSFGFN